MASARAEDLAISHTAAYSSLPRTLTLPAPAVMVLIDTKQPLPDAEQAPPPPSYPQDSSPPPAQPSHSYVPDPHQYPAYADMGMGPPFHSHSQSMFTYNTSHSVAYRTPVLIRCAQGEHEVTTTFGLCGIICAVLIFPLGLICLWCVHLFLHYDTSLTVS